MSLNNVKHYVRLRKFSFHCNVSELKSNHKIIADYANSLMSLINTFCFKEHKIHLIDDNAMQLKLGSNFYFLKMGKDR